MVHQKGCRHFLYIGFSLASSLLTMISALFHGPGTNKGASYFHPDHGLVDYVKQNVAGPYWQAENVRFCISFGHQSASIGVWHCVASALDGEIMFQYH